MSVSLAKAIAPLSTVASFDPLRDFRALYKLALYSNKFTPLAGIDVDLFEAFEQNLLERVPRAHTGLILNITGTERLHHGENALAQRILQLLAERKISARIGIASTIGAAWALSRCSREALIILPHTTLIREALAALPLAGLRLDSDNEARLHDLGIHSIGALLAIPSKTLAMRFGTKTLRRIHQLLGLTEEQFLAISPKTPPILSRSFEIPLMRKEAVHYTVLGLFDKLLLTLSLHGVRALSFIIRIEGLTTDREKQIFSKEIALNTVTRDISKLRGIVAPIVEEVHFHGGVTTITVASQQIQRLIAEQEDFTENPDNQRTLEATKELLNSFSVRLGPTQIKKAVFQESYLPERAFSYRAIQSNYIKLADEVPSEPRVLPDRPPYILSAPEPASALALLPDHPPARLVWRGVQHEIKSGVGPERIMPEWWNDPGAAERDYFKLQNQEGLWLWAFREKHTLSWWVHGLWV